MEPGYLCHRALGRTRVRIPERRRDSDYFERVARVLAACPGIEAVEANALTASLLVSHAGDVEALARLARDRDLFDLRSGPIPAKTLTDSVGKGGAAVSRALGQWTGGQADLAVVAFLFFVTLGVAQVFRGRVAIPAITAFWYAASVVLMSRKAGK
ncbi:MAG: hypothetical protein H7841_06500 [Magnetospirillum sp. WYHS-4]